MADDQRHAPDNDEPSLELPSLRSAFRRRRRPPEVTPAEPAPGESVPTQTSESAPDDSATAAAPGSTPEPVARRRRAFRVRLPGPLVAVGTGAIVGLSLVGLTAASLHACSSMRGTSSCGTPGILLLLAITAAMVLLGSLLLRLAGVSAHGSTSFLGVGLLVVLILLALLPVLDDWWVVIVVPALAMVTYAAAWWLTTTYVEPGERAR